MPWIFTYGSLMWRPCFSYEEKQKGTLHGYRRDFNKASVKRWGTPGEPAPTLGLETGGTAQGIAYRVSEDDFDAVMLYLKEREGPGFNFPRVAVELADGRGITAVVPVNEQDESYIGDLSLAERAWMAVGAEGEAGTGIEYVTNTYEQVEECGIRDEHVQEMAQRVRNILYEKWSTHK